MFVFSGKIKKLFIYRQSFIITKDGKDWGEVAVHLNYKYIIEIEWFIIGIL